MVDSKAKKQQNILNKMDELRQKAQIFSALVPLSGGQVPGHTWEEFDVAYRARQEIAGLMDQLQNLR